MVITINPVATVDAGGPDIVCQSSSPLPITLTGASVGGGANNWCMVDCFRRWFIKQYCSNKHSQNVTYTPAANFSGTVTLRLTTNDPTGPCPAVFDERTITVNPLPTAPTVTGAAICGPGVVDLSANGCAGGTLNGIAQQVVAL
jgi:hypothetical protein